MADPIQVLGDWLQLPASHPRYKTLFMKGPAGTGKTYSIKAFKDYINGRCVVVAPTNKAAKVLRQRGILANTIHRLCYAVIPTGRTKEILTPMIDPGTLTPMRDKNGKIIFKVEIEDICEYVFDEASIHKKAAEFCPNLPDMVSQTLIMIIDEASMVASHLWRNLLGTSFDIRIVAVGDGNQLPPVENDDDRADPALAPFMDYFLQHDADIELTVNHRQDADGDIVLVLNSILKNSTYPLPFHSEHVETMDLTYHRLTLADVAESILMKHDIVLAHRNKTVDLINTLMRNAIHKEIFKKVPMAERVLPVEGDKLYVASMYRVGREIILYKGDTVTITGVPVIDLVAGIAVIDCETDEGVIREAVTLDLGFCGYAKKDRKVKAATAKYGYGLTVHCGQGSQWPSVCFIDEKLPFNRKEMLYTGSSRAQTVLTILTGRF